MHHRKRRSDHPLERERRSRANSRANGFAGRGRTGPTRRRLEKARFASRAFGRIGYASGDERHRITVDFARDSRHGKYNLQSRAVRVSSARESVHTAVPRRENRMENFEPDHRRNAARPPFPSRSRQMVCSIGVMAAREVCPITTPAPRGTSVAKR